MDELVAYRQIERYKREQKRTGYSDEHRDFKLQGRERRTIPSVDEMFFLVFADDEIVVTSNLGIYDQLSEDVGENQHVHSGEMVLENFSDEVKNVEFIQVVWF